MSTKPKMATTVMTIPETAKPKAILPLRRAPSQSLANVALDQQENINAISPEIKNRTMSLDLH